MTRALKRAGIPYDYLFKPAEGDGFFKIADQRELARKLVAFFDKHIRPGAIGIH